jgi:enterochelin esterase-like enzyme
MRRRQLAPLALSPLLAQAALPQLQAGRLERIESFASRHVDARPVDVWLPPGYDPARRRYAVLYAHDGQILFDPRTTWNRQAWELDRAAVALMAAGRVRDFIVVAPWNNGRLRHAEYFPEGFLPHLPAAFRDELVGKALQGRPRANDYLRFLVEELKPLIDARYATRSERESTALMGSSMGGLISCYALCEYPRVFGAAACLSTHWIGVFEERPEVPDAAIAYLRAKLPPPATVRLWMDRGSTELDAKYATAQSRIDALMVERGYAAPGFVSRVYEGTGHNENAWRDRLPEVLGFLFAA